jgi:hypothetical protein
MPDGSEGLRLYGTLGNPGAQTPNILENPASDGGICFDQAVIVRKFNIININILICLFEKIAANDSDAIGAARAFRRVPQ